MMRILEYDEVDPLEVLQLNLLALGFALTPERVKLIRQYDPRPFPFFALYAIVDKVVAGQVGVFRLPMVSVDGPEDVGGVWAVCTHPSFIRRNIASRLLNEAHKRMQAEGLRFSTLGTSKHRVAHILYQKQGYWDIFFSASILFRHEIIKDGNKDLHIEQARHDSLHLADNLFRKISSNYLGFARRYEPFIPAMVKIGEIAMGRIEEKNIWFVWEKDKLVGYFIAEYSGSILNIQDILLKKNVNPLNAIKSLARKLPAPYIQIKSNYNSITKSLSDLLKDRILVVPQDWSTFMVKPLKKDVMKKDLKSLFGIGTDRFLFSWLDST
ncbi:MAG: GNAT family N-acetyltransferase [Candidatus Hodarchaeota archaeon]